MAFPSWSSLVATKPDVPDRSELGGESALAVPSLAGRAYTAEATVSRRMTAVGQGQLRMVVVLAAGAVLIVVAVSRAGGSDSALVAVVVALAGLFLLGVVASRYGLFSLGGITWVMISLLFVGQWYLSPKPKESITPQAALYVDQTGALTAVAIAVCFFAAAYAIGARPRANVLFLSLVDRRPTQESTSVMDLVVVSVALVVARLVTARFLLIGVPGRKSTATFTAAAALHLPGIIYYVTSYGPLVGAALILWFGRRSRSSNVAVLGVLLSYVLVESYIGSHGPTFEAILAYGATRKLMGQPVRISIGRALGLGLSALIVLTVGLLISFSARTSLNGNQIQSVGQVPSFLSGRLGGLEYIAPVVGAVNQAGPALNRLVPSTWNRFMTVQVYGLTSDAQTGFAATAIGWWYGLGRMRGVAVGAALSGLLSRRLDEWSSKRLRGPPRISTLLLAGLWLGWATFVLGGTITSLIGIPVGFAVTVLALAWLHRNLHYDVRGARNSRPLAQPGLD